MTPIASHIMSFLQQRLPVERSASDNTCESYVYAFKLFFEYASNCLKVPPSELHLEQLDAPLIVNFLNHLETARGNGASSRNIRLAAIKSFMRFMEYRVPTALEQIRRILAIPAKKPIRGLSDTSRLKRCRPSWMRLNQPIEMASGIEPCSTSASLEDCASLN